MDVTMLAAVLDNTDAVPPSSSPPTQCLFEAVDALAKKHLIEEWTASIKSFDAFQQTE